MMCIGRTSPYTTTQLTGSIGPANGKFAVDSGSSQMEYIVVVLADHAAGGEALVELIAAIDDLMLERHAPAE